MKTILKKFGKDDNPINEIVELVGQVVMDDDPDIADATVMVAHELLENAVKYGSSETGLDERKFELNRTDSSITITITNHVEDTQNIKEVIGKINQINESGDALKLYETRLLEIKDNRVKGESKLGLYRINYEGGFKLSYKYNNGEIQIIAVRNLER